MLSICSPPPNGVSEFYIRHHHIDTTLRNGELIQRTLLITTSRVVFGSLDPLKACRCGPTQLASSDDCHGHSML